MIAPAVLNLVICTQLILPGSSLTVEQATADSRQILVARVAEYGKVIDADGSKRSDCTLEVVTPLWNPSRPERASRFTLSTSGLETRPPVGEAWIFFLGSGARGGTDEVELPPGVSDRIGRLIQVGARDVIIKVEPDTPATRAAIQDQIHRPGRSGSKLTLEAATASAARIVVGTPRLISSVGAGGYVSSLYEIAPTAVLKGSARVGWSRLFGAGGSVAELVPRAGSPAIYCFDRFGGGDQLINTFPDTPANRATIDAFCPPTDLPGHHLTIAQATAQAHAVVVGRTLRSFAVGAGPATLGSHEFQPGRTWKGTMEPGGSQRLGFSAPGAIPVVGRDYLLFIAPSPSGPDRIIKFVAVADVNVAAIQGAIASAGAGVAPPPAGRSSSISAN